MRGRTAIVTGGASGIGGAISARLAAGGAMVAIFDRDGDAAAAAAASIAQAGGTAIGLPVDVTDRVGIDAGAGEVRARLGRPVILVNSAGMTAVSPFLDITAEAWNRVLAVNLTGTFDCCQAVLPVGRIGQPEDVAAACAFLVSEEAGYITGQVIGVNGGRNT